MNMMFHRHNYTNGNHYHYHYTEKTSIIRNGVDIVLHIAKVTFLFGEKLKNCQNCVQWGAGGKVNFCL